MQYVLTGFKQDLGFRVFGFEKIGQHFERTAYTVRADLALTRKYAIRMQELPLLCRLLLERCDQSDGNRSFTLTEEEMSIHAKSSVVARPAHPFRRKFPPGGATGGASA